MGWVHGLLVPCAPAGRGVAHTVIAATSQLVGQRQVRQRPLDTLCYSRMSMFLNNPRLSDPGDNLQLFCLAVTRAECDRAGKTGGTLVLQSPE